MFLVDVMHINIFGYFFSEYFIRRFYFPGQKVIYNNSIVIYVIFFWRLCRNLNCI
ncbi:hypothetical protein A6A12_2498 [Vibrio anguillarum]|nr:hypothetical protein A6A12_2498 [Vibrio anguillarum]